MYKKKKVVVKHPTYIDPRFILYDIETLPWDFTNSVYIAKEKRFIIYVDSKTGIDDKTAGKIRQIALSRFKGLVETVTFVSGATQYRRMRTWLLFGYEKDGLVRAGWNSKHFDVPVIFALLNGQARDARFLADDIIGENKRPYQLSYSDGSRIDYQILKSILGDVHHIDISLLNEKSGDVDASSKARTPAGLKMVSAYAGLEVLDDEVTRIDFNSWDNGTWYSLPKNSKDLVTINGDLTEHGFKRITGVTLEEFQSDRSFWDNMPAERQEFLNADGTLSDSGLLKITGYPRDRWRAGTWATLDDSLKVLVNIDSSLTVQGLIEMITYNMQDVLNTGLLFEMPEYSSAYHVKSGLINKFDLNRTEKVASPSDTSARLSGLTLTNGDSSMFRDKMCIDFQFPLPSGEHIDLLDYLYERKIIPPVLYDYYALLRGRDALSRDEMNDFLKKADELLSKPEYSIEGTEVKPAYPWNHASTHTNATVTVPYFDINLNPIRSYNTFSRGGSHGATSKNAVNFTFNDARMIKIRAKKIAKTKQIDCTVYDADIQKQTMDMSAWAIDADSFYPTFLVKLGVYRLADGTDVYDQIRRERLAVKASLPKNKRDYTDEDNVKNREQLGSKLILNSVSGASNTMNPKALLALDNAIMSMRLMGNLFIYMIATYFVRELGAEVLSTNTDGIEISFDTLPEDQRPDANTIEALSILLTYEYGFVLEPEHLTRFVVKDANNRIEWHGDVINKSAGKLNKGFNPTYANVDDDGNIDNKPNRIGLDSKLDHPMCTDLAVLAYIDAHKDYLNPSNKIISPTKTRPATPEVLEWLTDWLKSYANGEYHELIFNVFDWLLFTKGNASRHFFGDGVKLQDNNRYVYVHDGINVTSTMKNSKTGERKPTKITGWTSNSVKILNTIDALNEIEPEMLNYDAYAQWAYKTLLVWVNDEQTKPDKTTKIAVPPKRRTKKVETPTDKADKAPEKPVEDTKPQVSKKTASQVKIVVTSVLDDVNEDDETSVLAKYLASVSK